MTYCCPDPTPEQIENGKLHNYRPEDRCGAGALETSPCDILCAACLIHDELFLIGGSIEDFHKANANFSRDCMILATAADEVVTQLLAAVKALEYTMIISTVAWQFWKSEDRNTLITRAQGEAFMDDAKAWINECAESIDEPIPYPEIV